MSQAATSIPSSADISEAYRSRLAFVGLYTFTRRMGRTALIARRYARACPPEPSIPSVEASGLAMTSTPIAASPATRSRCR